LEEVSRKEQGEPAAHGGTDDDLGAVGLVKDGDSLFEPARDGAVIEAATRLTVTGIIESRYLKAQFGAESVEGVGLEPGHYRAETIEPEKPGRFSGALDIGDIAVLFSHANAKELSWKGSHAELFGRLRSLPANG